MKKKVIEIPKAIQTLFVEYNGSIAENVPNLNKGGCGIFAEHLYKTLVKMGFAPRLIVITNNAYRMDERIKNIGMGYLASIGHIVVEFGGKFIDSTGIYKHPKDIGDFYYHGYNETTDTLSIEVLETWNADEENWNRRFNRSHISRVKTIITDAYEKARKDLVVSK